MTLTELAQKVYNARSLPGELAELHIELAAMYSNMNDDMVDTQLKKADFWKVKDNKTVVLTNQLDCNDKKEMDVKRQKPLSDTAVEMMWLQTEEGKKEIKLKYTLRSLEKLMQACKSSLVNASIEARNI